MVYSYSSCYSMTFSQVWAFVFRDFKLELLQTRNYQYKLVSLIAFITGPPGPRKRWASAQNSCPGPLYAAGRGLIFPFPHPAPQPGPSPAPAQDRPLSNLLGKIRGPAQGRGGEWGKIYPPGPCNGLASAGKTRPAPPRNEL